MTEDLRVDVSAEADDTCVVTVVGELEPSTAPQLERELQASAFTSNCTRLVIDLTGVTFMDSSGLGVVLNAHKKMRARDGRLVVRQPSRTVQRLLEITALTNQLVIE
jgi:anti-anti-sigma factor